jgi:hypothetical protein
MPGISSETQGSSVMVFGSNIVVQCSVGPIITLHGRITAMEYVDRLGNPVHLMIQRLFPNKEAVFQVDNAHIHTTGTVQSWFEQHEVNLTYSLAAKSPDFNIIEPLWSVLETKSEIKIPTSNIGRATWSCSSRRIVQNSARDY